VAVIAPASRNLAALLAGTVFGAGLAVAQMIDPRKVLGFLDVAGPWDASLLFVLGGAVLVATIGFRVVLHRQAPLLDAQFHLGTQRRIDAPLLLGSGVFGVGWGLGGYCPGPAIASLGFGNAEALWFLPAMVVGAVVQRWQARARPAAPEESTARDAAR
jgi:uncharacterized membrane protein YedE/YeeE